MFILHGSKAWKRSAVENGNGKGLACSFCGKKEDAVGKLIAGPKVFICNECIELCNEILSDEVPDERASRAEDAA